MMICRFSPEFANQTAEMIAQTLRISNSRDYTKEYLDAVICSHSADFLCRLAATAHLYIAIEGSSVIGCGAIDGYWGSETESIFLTIFVHPAYQKQGIGRRLVETLEQDEFFLRARRIEIPASVTAVEFYKKMGYSCKNGITTPDAEGLIRLEKFR